MTVPAWICSDVGCDPTVLDTMYNRAWRIQGPFDLYALDSALQFILECHQVPAMRVGESNGELIRDGNAAEAITASCVEDYERQ